jgi:ascorbate-specific PTS system EIIC-type component UlaA
MSALAGISNFLIPNSYEPAVTFSAIFPIADSAAIIAIFTIAFVSNASFSLFPVYRLSRTIETVPDL